MSQDNNEDFSYNMDNITEDNAPVVLDVDGRISLKVPDEDEVPASGIILNKEHMAERNKILPHSIPDERFPDTTLFQYINDDEKYPNKGINELMDWMNLSLPACGIRSFFHMPEARTTSASPMRFTRSS